MVLLIEGGMRWPHRGDYETCPHCLVKYDDETWAGDPCELVLRPRIYNSGCCAVYSWCPACQEISWVHYELGSIDTLFPADWRHAAARELSHQKIQALRAWARGLCGHCEFLAGGNVDCSTFRECRIGMGPVRESCDQYQKVTEENT